MKPLNLPWLLVALLAAAAVGAAGSQAIVSRGAAVPVAGWLTGIVLLILAGVLLLLGLPLRRYLRESEERHQHPSLAPRRHQLDLPTAFRTILLARAAALTGAIVGGLFVGQGLFLLDGGGGDLVRAVLPTAFAALGGVVLGVAGIVVERWGTLPPDDGGGATESTGTRV